MVAIAKINTEKVEVIVEQFLSKYALKTRVIYNKIYYQGKLGNLPEELQHILDSVEIKPETKFILIYKK